MTNANRHGRPNANRHGIHALIAALLLAFACSTFVTGARAEVAPPDIAARSWLLLDMTTGATLVARDPDRRIEPASLTKLMTAYLVFNALRDKRLTIDQRPPVSPLAYKAGGSRMFVDPRNPARVDELLNGLIVQSGNDAAVVLAEAVGTTETQFATMMNAEADEARHEQHEIHQCLRLARSAPLLDRARPGDAGLATDRRPSRVLQALFAQRDYTYNNIKQPNRNRLLFTDPTVDGVKTGHTDAAGYCLISSAKREDTASGLSRRLVAVVLGANSESSRAIESQKLLNFGFQNYQVVRLYKKDAPLASYKVFKAKAPEVRAGFSDDVCSPWRATTSIASRARSSATSR